MININMVAERRARRMREVTTLRFATLAVLCVLIFSVLLNMERLMVCRGAMEEKKLAESKLTALDTKRRELTHVNDQIDQKRPVVDLLAQVRVSEFAWMTILADTSRVTPEDVFLSSFDASTSQNGISLHMAGTARDEQTVGLFMTAIREKTGWAQLSTLSSLSAASDERLGKRVHFDLTIPVRDLMGGEL